MKAVCDRASLLADLTLADGATSKRDIKPILKDVKAVAAGDTLTLLATDLELGIRLTARRVEVQRAGEAILPAAKLTALLRESTDDRLTVEADGTAVVVTGRQFTFRLPGGDPDDFVDVPTFDGKKYHELTAGALRTMIRRTAFAAAKESTRYAMTGVVWELDAEHIRLVATDSKRLALATGSGKAVGGHATAGGQSHIVPTKAMTLLERNLHDDDEPVRVCLRPNEVLFQTERATVYGRLVEGRFPPYRDILPKKYKHTVSLPVGPFREAVRQVVALCDDDGPRVTLRLAADRLTLVARPGVDCHGEITVPVKWEGVPIEVAFDPHYLAEMLAALDGEPTVTLSVNDGTKPASFKCGADYDYLLMPLP